MEIKRIQKQVLAQHTTENARYEVQFIKQADKLVSVTAQVYDPANGGYVGQFNRSENGQTTGNISTGEKFAVIASEFAAIVAEAATADEAEPAED